MKRGIILLIAVLSLLATPAYAVRCGNRLVIRGDAKTEVWYKCGEPVAVDYRVTYVAVHSPLPAVPELFHPSHQEEVYIPVVTEVWTYNFGPRRFMQEFCFNDGRLTDIQALGYGY